MTPKILAAARPETPISETQLIQQVGTWSDKNFGDKRGAEWGILEEIGEAAHCVLKARQRIRGFEDQQFFIAKFSDALADIMIYLADWCYLHDAFFKLGRNQVFDLHPNDTDERRIVIHMVQGVSQMFTLPEVFSGDKISATEIGVYNMAAQRICNGAECWASIHDIDLRFVLAATWAKVGARDWKKNPQAPAPEHA